MSTTSRSSPRGVAMLHVFNTSLHYESRSHIYYIARHKAALVGWLLSPWGKTMSFLSGPLLHYYNNFVAIKPGWQLKQKHSKNVYVHNRSHCVLFFSENNHKNTLSVCTFTLAVACRLCLDPLSSACQYGIHSRSTNSLPNCAVALLEVHHMHNSCIHAAIRSTCKSFHVSPCTLLIVPSNSIYYNYGILRKRVAQEVNKHVRQKYTQCMTYRYVNMNEAYHIILNNWQSSVVFLFYRLPLSSAECEKLQPSTGICLTQYCVQPCQVLHNLCFIR